MFTFLGATPRTGWLDGNVACDGRGFVLTGADLDERHLRDWPLERAPYLLETSVPGIYPRYTVEVEPSQVLRVDKRDFPEMLSVSLEVGQRLVAEMSNRVRGDVRLEQQQEKMMALGKLSAGLAHELNNPAAAVGRAASTLAEHLAKLPVCVTGLMRQCLDEDAIAAIQQLPVLVRAREPVTLTPLERAEREDTLAEWLEGHGVADGWHLAGTFADVGLRVDDLESCSAKVPGAALNDALVWVECELAAEGVVSEIASSAERISSLISAVKTYSHMDRSFEHELTDVREGLDNTLEMLGHKLDEKNIELERDYQANLPEISAHAGELNQVGTNLIDNAIDAIGEGGTLRVEAREDERGIVVRVIDDGPGIPDEYASVSSTRSSRRKKSARGRGSVSTSRSASSEPTAAASASTRNPATPRCACTCREAIECPAQSLFGASWSADDRMVFGQGPRGV